MTLGCAAAYNSSSPYSFNQWCGQPAPQVTVDTASDPDVVILTLQGLTVTSAGSLTITGDKPVILVVFGHVSIDGTVNASASGTTSGPGGNLSCGSAEGENGTGTRNLEGGGGGGGGFGTAGGDGGDNRGGDGGSTRGNATIVPLIGGCNGGNGGGNGGNGGAGAGAVQISVSGTLTVTGTIRANGAVGARYTGDDGGGGGGGSGGAILLEGKPVTTSGSTITANGGDGGDGQDGSNTGGDGSISPSQDGRDGTGNDALGSGGGGGGYGRVRINQG